MRSAPCAALWLCLALSGCGLRYARTSEPLVLPASPCRLLLGQDEWQYPPREVRPPPFEGLPDDVRACLMAGISAERTEGPRLARALEARLKALGWLEAKVDDGLAATLGPRYAFGAVTSEWEEAAGELEGPFVWAQAVLVQERLSRRAGCKVEVQRGEPDVEQHRVPVVFSRGACAAR